MDENNLNNLGFDPNSNGFNQQPNLNSFQPNGQFPEDQSMAYDPFGNPINTQDVNDYSNSMGPVSNQELNYNSQNTQPFDTYDQMSLDQQPTGFEQFGLDNNATSPAPSMDDSSFAQMPMDNFSEPQFTDAQVPNPGFSELPMDNSFDQEPMNQMPMDDSFSQDPMSQVPMDNSFAQEPMSQIPLDDNFTQEPMSQIPMDNNFTQEPISQMPMNDNFSQEPVSQIPMDDNFAQEPMNQVPMDDNLGQEPVNQIPIDNTYGQDPMMNQMPLDNVYGQDPMMNQMPMDNAYGQDPMANQMPMDNAYSQDPMMNQMPMDNAYGQDPMMNQMPMDNAYGQDPMMNQMPMDNTYGQDPMMNQMPLDNAYGQDMNQYDPNMQQQPMDNTSYDDFPGSNTQYLQSNNLIDNPATNGPYVEHMDNNTTNNTTGVPTDYAQAYMTNIYDKVNANKFNWCAALLGPSYYMFRKNYLSGLLFAILQYLVFILIAVLVFNFDSTSLTGLIIGIVWCIIANLGFGFIFDKIYKGKLNNLFEKDQHIEYAQKNGGTSFVGLIIGFLLNGALSALSFAVFSLVGISSLLSGQGVPPIEPDNTTDWNTVVTNTIDSNTVDEPVTSGTKQHVFGDYQITYDNSKWSLKENEAANNFSFENIEDDSKLYYFGMNASEDFAAFGDATTEQGRKAIYELFKSTLIPTTFYPENSDSIDFDTPIISETNDSLNQPTFIKKGNSSIYIGRVDAKGPNQTTRYYLVIPSDSKQIMAFYLQQVNSLEVSSELDTAVETMLISIKAKESGNNEEDENLIDLNSISGNTINDENELPESNTTENDISNDVNETNTTDGNNTTSNLIFDDEDDDTIHLEEIT